MLAYLYTKPVNKCFCKITICINTMMIYLTLFTKLNFDVRSTFKLYYFVEYLIPSMTTQLITCIYLILYSQLTECYNVIHLS